MSIHIEPNGTYAACAEADCQLPIHLPLNTVAEAQTLPYPILLDLIETFDPPSRTFRGEKVWRDAESLLHRDYDLPAVILSNGTMKWLHHGSRHRLHDKPAHIYADSRREWYQHDALHRNGDLPAVITSTGSQQWYLMGVRYEPFWLESYVREEGMCATVQRLVDGSLRARASNKV